MMFLINAILLSIIFLYLWRKYKKENVYLIISLSVTGYTFLIPGLTFIDIFSVVFFLINIRKITKISFFSLIVFLNIIYQVILNLFYYVNNQFLGTLFSTIIPVLHKYIPLLLIIIIIENVIINTKPFFIKYRNSLIVILILFVIAKLLIIIANEPTIKILAFTTGLSGVVAILTPYWFVVYNNSRFNKSALIILIISLAILLISDIRGSLIIFFILLAFSILPILKRKLFLMVLPLILLLSFYMIKLIKQSEELMSIINLQLGLMFNLTIDLSLLSSSERVRYNLWTRAKEVWEDNFFFGIGTNQFRELNVLIGRDEQLSPHHAIYSIATEGGIIAVILSLLPALIIIFKNQKNKTKELYWLKMNATIYIMCAFMFGYTLNIYIIITLYISLINSTRSLIRDRDHI